MPAEKQKSIAVDLDGVLLYFSDWKSMKGEPGDVMPGAAEFVSGLRNLGFRIVLWTRRLTRHPNQTEQVLGKLREAGIEIDEVWTQPGKPSASYFIDDRALCIRKNPEPEDFQCALELVESLEAIDAR